MQESSEKTTHQKVNQHKITLWEWTLRVAIIITLCAFTYKFFISDSSINISIDLPTFLSLVLALFSVGLSALFYFKATESSNAFYDNTYKFTQDIAQLLVKIDSGFGERLRSLDENYVSIRDRVYNHPNNEKGSEEANKLVSEEEKTQEILLQREDIIKKLLDNSKLKEKELAEASQKLIETEQSLKSSIQKQMEMSRNDSRGNMRAIRNYLRRNFFKFMKDGYTLINSSNSEIQEYFQNYVSQETPPKIFMRDLEIAQLYSRDNGLTSKGCELIRNLAIDTFQ